MAEGESLDEIAAAIQRRGLASPAIFLLEMHKPLVGCMRELYTVAEPVARALFGSKWGPMLREFLESPERVEQLIERLEKREAR